MSEVIEHFGVPPNAVRAVPLAASSHFRPVTPASPRKSLFPVCGDARTAQERDGV